MRRDALSPSPAPLSPSPSATARSRERSRSPYRTEGVSRGEKRRRTDDYSRESTRADTRRFKVHYEDGTDRRSSGRRDGPNDKDRGQAWNTNVLHDERDERERYRDKRPRTRSRSPTRYVNADERSGRTERDHRGGRRNSRDRGDRNKYGHGGSHRQSFIEQSVSENGLNFKSDVQRSTENVAHGSAKTQQQTSATNGKTASSRSGNQNLVDADEAVGPPANETLSIEERRKRREAIKAKYKSQTTPLLVQALEGRNPPGSPASSHGSVDATFSRSASPVDSSPSTPLHDTAHGSPPSISILDDSELANTAANSHVDETDEPSAADYDPMMDMQEEKARVDRRQREDGVSASTYDEMAIDRNEDNSPPKPDVAIRKEPAVVSNNNGGDMFASDDEDDMFAPAASTKTATSDADPNTAFTGPKAKELDMSMLDNWDDPEGYYRVILGELLDGRYHVQANLGKGMFSSVVRAQDSQTDQLVAIKVIRNNETMLKAGQKEMDILQKLADADPEDKKHLIRLERSFTHKGHLCMVFENLSINLREVLKKFGRDVGINLKAVRSYAQQMFLGLSLLRKCNILHADIKPDNILVNEARNMLKICDLGSAGDASDNDITPYLVSRFYRAPEIILGIPYDFAIDMWSIGCTLFELYTGKILFTGRTNNQMLRSIMECRGKFSLKMLKKAEFGAVHFDDNNLHFRSMERDKITGREVMKLINFVKPTRDLKSRLLAGTSPGPGQKVIPEADLKEVNLFADLLERCLSLNPERRLTPAEALKHPFIHRAVTGFMRP